MEQRLRIVIHLPNKSASENTAFSDVLDFIVSKRQAPLSVKGFSRLDSVSGYWLSAQGKWVRDRVSLLIIDTLPAPELERELGVVKAFAHQAYLRSGRPQEEIWIVSHLVNRHTSAL